MFKPNLVYIITDQQRYDTINELGYNHMETPNLDKLVREGTTFTNCFTAGLSCAPSRGAIFSNYYPHTTGIIKNACTWNKSWFNELKNEGYHTLNIGKMHTWPLKTPCGFAERYNVENKDRFLEARYYFDEWDKALAAHGLIKQRREEYRLREDYKDSLGAFYWELPEKLHSDMFVGDMACWWLNNYPKTEPLCMQIGFPGPHPPYDPIKRYADIYMEKINRYRSNSQ
jgi:arylsulfatase A-like enzyme